MKQILEMKGIYKSFGSVSVLEGVDFSLEKGEIRALLGANGAGKSTLIKIIGGAHKETKGEIYLRGEKTTFADAQDSREKGISIIYQELSLVPTLTVLENMFLGREIVGAGRLLNKREMLRKYKEICDDFEFAIDPDVVVSQLSIANQQMVEIMKAVSCNADIIVMDEPTTSLTDNEKEGMFKIIGRLKEMQKSIIYITHILDEVFRICDTASMMRNGKIVGSYDIQDLTKAKIAELMTGVSENELGKNHRERQIDYQAAPVLEVKNLCRGNKIKNISFKVHKGEVIGLAGLVGSMRTETANLIFGVDKLESGQIYMNGDAVTIQSPAQAISHKIGYIPEDRKNLGLILEQEIYKNAVAVQLSRFKKYCFLDEKAQMEFTQYGIKHLSVKNNSIHQKIKELSGGNQQKIVVSKWLQKDMDLLIYDEPTKGIDIAAKEDIFKTIDEFSANGTGIIFISSDLEEVIRVADKIIVMRDGSVVCEMENQDITVQDIMDKIFDVG